MNSVAVHLTCFSNSNASRLKKLHTHFCHDVPCPLPSTVADLDYLFMLSLTVFSLCCLTQFFFNTNASRLTELHTHFCHDALCPLPSTVADTDLSCLASQYLTLFLKHRSLWANNFIHTTVMTHPVRCHCSLLTLTYF